MLICFGGHGRSWLILCPVTPRFLRLEPYHVSHDCNDGVFVILDTQKHSLHVSAIYSSSYIHCGLPDIWAWTRLDKCLVPFRTRCSRADQRCVELGLWPPLPPQAPPTLRMSVQLDEPTPQK